MNRTKRLLVGAPVLFAAALMQAQTTGAGLTPTLYDMTGFYDSELNGTARYVGMGGAMSALGGDISVISTNPAGIGLYRKNDVAVTGGVVTSKSDMGTFGKSEKQTNAVFNQAGFVYSNHVDGPSLTYFNLGFNYHRLKDFTGRTNWRGTMPGYRNGDYNRTASQTTLIADMTNGMGVVDPLTEDDYNKIKNASNANDYYQNASDVAWLTIMGIRSGVITPMYNDQNKLTGFDGYDGGTGDYYGETKGSIDAYDFNMSFNFNDRVYLGATLTALDVNYNYYSSYQEDLYDAYAKDPNQQVATYLLQNSRKTTGTGVNVNLGLIVRPFEDSPFRFGVAVKTPTWYRLTDTYSATMSAFKTESTALSYDYRFQTPWSFNLSLGHTIGNSFAIGAEYEYTDYSTAKLKDADGNDGDENQYIKQQLKAVNLFKIGAEWKPVSCIAIRAGYNYLSNVMKTGDEYNYTPGYNSINTRTDYVNMKDGYNLTLGLGYSGKNFYADLSYQYNCRNYDFYPFALSGSNNGQYVNMIPSTDLKTTRQQALLTIGYKF